MEEAHKYNAFISYSHAADRALASALRAGLHRFARPWNQLRALRVFVDESSLAADPALWPTIERELRQSEFLILLASPEAAASAWVARELEFWKEHKPLNNLLIALSAGEIRWDEASGDFDWNQTSALPGCLRRSFAVEPRFVDVRAFRAGVDKRGEGPDFSVPIADLAAPLHGRPKDELIGEDVRQHRRALRLQRMVIGGLATLTLGLAIFVQLALSQRNQALITQSRYLSDLSRQVLERGDSGTAVLLALEALPAGGGLLQRPYVPEAEVALYNAIKAHREILTLSAHEGPVNAVAFAPKEARFASASSDGTVKVWDAESGALLHTLDGHGALVSHVHFCEGSGLVATAGDDEAVRFWRGDSGEPVQTLRLESESPTEGWLGRLDTVIQGISLRALQGNFLPGEDMGSIKTVSIVLSANCERILARSLDKGLVAWTGNGRSLPARVSDHDDWILAAAFKAELSRAATIGDEGTVRVWDLARGAPLFSHQVEAGSPDGLVRNFERLASSAGVSVELDGSIREAFDSVALRMVSGAAFSPDLQRLAIARVDGVVELLDAGTGSLLRQLSNHNTLVLKVLFLGDGNRLLTIMLDGTARLWDSGSGQLVAEFSGLEAPRRVVVSPDSAAVLTLSHGGTARLTAMPQGRRLAEFRVPSRISSATFSPDGNRILTGDEDGVLRLWSVSAKPAVAPVRYDLGSNRISGAVFTADGTQVVGVSDDGMGRVWNVASGEPARAFGPAAGSMQSTSFGKQAFTTALSPQGDLAAWGSRSAGTSKVELWRLSTRQRLQSIELDRVSFISRMTFSGDGKRLIVVDNGNLTVLDTATGDVLAERWYPGFDEVLRGDVQVELDPSGEYAVSWHGSEEEGVLRGTLSALAGEHTQDLGPVQISAELIASHRDQGIPISVFSAVADHGHATVLSLPNGEVHLFANCRRLWGCKHHVLRSHSALLRRVVFNGDEHMVTFDEAGGAALWDLRGGRLIRADLSGKTAVFQSDGERLVTGPFPLQVRDARTGALVTELSHELWPLTLGAPDPVSRLTLGPGDEKLLVQTPDSLGLLPLFRDTQSLLNYARRETEGRSLTATQRQRFFID